MNQNDEQMLQTQLGEARERLDGLARDLAAIDDELEGLSTEREQYRLLSDVCGSLERLEALGAAELFWGARIDAAERGQLGRAWDRVKAFELRLEEIEERRGSVVHAIQLQQDDTEILEDDLFEMKLREERRKLEWVVEREMDPLPPRASIMPWSRGGEDDRRFRKSLALSLAFGLLASLLLPLIDLPLPERWEPSEVPERLARLIREERPLPPPPPQQPTPEKVKSDPEVVAETSPEPPTVKNAESKGILAFREKFTGLARSSSAARLGSQARISSVADAANRRPTRSMVTTDAMGSSGGINLASLSRDVGGSGGNIEGVQVARATSGIGGGGTAERPLSNGPGPGRTDEEIQIVFDRHKSALYRLYNRALRQDPTLQGQIVLRLRIEPDGSVPLCEVHASDMNAPQLATQVVARVRSFDFGAKEGVPPITIVYPIDFLPAT